jgi:hypothetical protein
LLAFISSYPPFHLVGADEARGNTTIGGIFANNRVYFNHGQGGAVHIRNVTGTAVVSINASFANNTASEVCAHCSRNCRCWQDWLP